MEMFRIASWETSLLGRGRGADLRDVILEAAGESPVVRIDFDGVETMSLSFADECFGELFSTLRDRNPESSFHFVGASDDQEARLRQVLARRTELARR